MISIRKGGILLLLCVLPLLLASSPEHGEDHGSSSGEFFAKVINFSLLFGGLGFLLRKPIKTFFVQLSEKIDLKIREAEQSRKDALADLGQVQERLVSLTQEVEGIKSSAEQQGREEQVKIQSTTDREAERLRLLAGQEIGILSRHGMKDIRAYTAELACTKALQRIKSKLNPEIHSRLIDQSIDRLADIYEKSSSH